MCSLEIWRENRRKGEECFSLPPRGSHFDPFSPSLFYTFLSSQTHTMGTLRSPEAPGPPLPAPSGLLGPPAAPLLLSCIHCLLPAPHPVLPPLASSSAPSVGGKGGRKAWVPAPGFLAGCVTLSKSPHLSGLPSLVVLWGESLALPPFVLCRPHVDELCL